MTRRRPLFLLWLVALACADTCTVGVGLDFTTVQEALDGCGAPGDVLMVLQLEGILFVETLTIPPMLRELTLERLSASGSAPVLQGAGHLVTLDSELWLTLDGVVLDGGGSTQPLFADTLMNVNISLYSSVVRNFQGDHVIWLESCSDNTRVEFFNTNFSAIANNAIDVRGVRDFLMYYCDFVQVGGHNVTSFGSVVYLFVTDVSEGLVEVVGNTAARLCRMTDGLCQYCLDDFCNAQCDSGTVRLWDKATTTDLGLCPEEPVVEIYNGLSDATVIKTNVPPVFCRTYVVPACQTVQLDRPSNITGVPTIVSYQTVGDVWFADSATRHFCVAAGTVSPYTYSLIEHLPSIGDQAASAALGWSSGVVSSAPFINTTCVCGPEPPFGECEAISLFCNYTLTAEAYCDEGVAYCCAGGVSNCTLGAYTPCPCSGNELVPLPGGGSYQCVVGAPTCPCDTGAFNALFPPRLNSTWMLIDNLQPRLTRFRWFDNSAHQFDIGARFAQTDSAFMRRFSPNAHPYIDEHSFGRILHRHDSGRVRGASHDYNLGAPGSMFQWYCDSGCWIPFLTREEAACICNDEFNDEIPGFGVTLFADIQSAYNQATSGGCARDGQRSILIESPITYYQEKLDLTDDADNVVLYSLDNALIVGNGHGVDGDARNITWRGVTFSHTGSKQEPFFLIRDSDMESMTFEGCTVLHNDARRSGLVDTSRLLHLRVRHCTFRDAEESVVKLKDPERVEFEFNHVEECVGKCVQILGFTKWVRFNWNRFNESRGGERMKGAPLVTLSAADRDEVCDGLGGRLCSFWGNRQYLDSQVENFDDCYRDVCFLISRGAWNASAFIGNRCMKAQFGFDLFMTTSLGTPELRQLMLQNPEVRPSLLQNAGFCEDRKRAGFDYRVRTFVSGTESGSIFGGVRDEASVNFLDTRYALDLYERWLNGSYQCEVNTNYGGAEWMRDYQPNTPAYAFYQYRNVSDSTQFCSELPNELEGDALIYVTNENGSRYRYEDGIKVKRPVWLIGDETRGHCLTPRYRPMVRGLNHVLDSPWHNQTRMCYEFRQNEPREEDWMWRSGDMPQQLLIFDQCCFNGRMLVPNADLKVLAFSIGESEATAEFGRAIKKGSLPPLTRGALFFTNNSFYAWSGINEDLFEQQFYPFVEPMIVSCVNLVNSISVVAVQNNNFSDIDSVVFDVRECNQVVFANNTLRNCGARSPRSDSVIKYLGNTLNTNYTVYPSDQRSVLYVLNNTVSQDDVRYRVWADDVTSPTTITAFRFTGVGNTTDFCFLDNYVSDLMTPVKWERTQRFVLNQCSLRNVSNFFPDLRRQLRAVCQVNHFPPLRSSQFHSYVWDIGRNRDRYGDFLYCDVESGGTCCTLADPTVCFVDRFDLPGYAAIDYYSANNPWYGRFIFDDLEDAIFNCQAKRREIVLVGSQDLFGVDNGVDAYKVYDFWFSYTVGPRLLQVTNTSDNSTMLVPSYDDLVIRGSRGMEVCTPTYSHFLNTTDDIRVRVVGVRFRHCRDDAGATWHQPVDASSYYLSLDSNLFNGDRVAVRPVDGTYDDQFRFRDNLLANYTSGVDGARFLGRTCNGVDTIRVTGNTFVAFAGATLEVLDWPTYIVNSNEFILCGGRTSLRNYATLMRVCDDALPGRLDFRENELVSTMNSSASLGYWTAFAFDPVPDGKLNRIEANRADGLEVGMRLLNYPNNPPSSDPKQRLRIIWANLGNYRVEGSWHDVRW